MDQILLHRATGRRFAHLREITGLEEQGVSNTTTADAISLIQQLLLVPNDDALKADEVPELTPWERDRLLAMIYTRLYGPRIDSIMNCRSCEAPYDVDFNLQTLMDRLAPTPAAEVAHLGDAVFEWHNVRFRLPTGRDECAVSGLPKDQAEAELFQRCILDSNELDARTSSGIQAAMQTLSPVVDLELNAGCPECGKTQTLRFDLQRFLLTALLNDRTRLLHEIHVLAAAYSWSLSDILNLPRSQRRSFVALVDADDMLEKAGR